MIIHIPDFNSFNVSIYSFIAPSRFPVYTNKNWWWTPPWSWISAVNNKYVRKVSNFSWIYFHILIVSRIVPSVLPAIFAIELYKNPKILFFGLSKRFERRGAYRKFLASDDGCQLLANVVHFMCQKSYFNFVCKC